MGTDELLPLAEPVTVGQFEVFIQGDHSICNAAPFSLNIVTFPIIDRWSSMAAETRNAPLARSVVKEAYSAGSNQVIMIMQMLMFSIKWQ